MVFAAMVLTTQAQILLNETQTAHSIRRAVQKVRVCNPDTYDELQQELKDALANGESELGSLSQQVQEECERGLELARRRVEIINQQRAEEAEKYARPMELIQEMASLFESFQDTAKHFQEQVCPTEEDPLTAEKLPDSEVQTSTFEQQIKEFTQTLKEFASGKAVELQDKSLPPHIKSSWVDLVKRISDCTKEAQKSIDALKKEIAKIKLVAKQELLDAAKERIAEKLKRSQAASAISDATKVVQDLEEKVTPFLRLRTRPEEELNTLAYELSSDAEATDASLSGALEQMRPDSEEEDPEIKAAVEAFAVSQTRLQTVKLGQLKRRVQRIYNILARHKKDLRKNERFKIIAELKQPFIEKVKAVAVAEILEQVTAAVKEAEQEVTDLGKKSQTLSPTEMSNLAEKIDGKVQAAKDSVAYFRQQLCPLDESLEEDIKQILRDAVAADVKLGEQKLGMQERKLTRVVNLATSFRADIKKKKAALSKSARGAVLKFVGAIREAEGNGEGRLTIEDLFNMFDTDKDGSVSENEFLAFFADNASKVQGKVLKTPTEEELRFLFISNSEDEGNLTLDQLKQAVSVTMEVVKVTALTDGLSIQKSQAVRELSLGEVLEVVEGPEFETTIKVNRVKVRAYEDGAVGWASVAGNAGTAYLKEKTA